MFQVQSILMMEIVAETNLNAENASPIAHSPDYSSESDLEADPEEDEMRPICAFTTYYPSQRRLDPFETDDPAATPPPYRIS
ncbi:hypothetical protein Tco_1102901 [Tanacetum coccineum]